MNTILKARVENDMYNMYLFMILKGPPKCSSLIRKLPGKPFALWRTPLKYIEIYFAYQKWKMENILLLEIKESNFILLFKKLETLKLY